MSALRNRLEAIRRRLPSGGTCPEHAVGLAPRSDWRDGFRSVLRAFSPDPADRAAYQRDQEQLAATPPYHRCGWQPDAVFIVTPGHWGRTGPDDGSAA